MIQNLLFKKPLRSVQINQFSRFLVSNNHNCHYKFSNSILKHPKKEQEQTSPAFPVRPITPTGYIKTAMTDRLAILSKLVYWMKEYSLFLPQSESTTLLRPAQNQKSHPFPLTALPCEENPLYKYARYVDFLPHIEDIILIDFDGYSSFLLDEKNKYAFFAFRGTKSYNLYDLANCISITCTNKPQPRIDSTKMFVIPYLEWLKTTGRADYRILLTGHSLGGSVAEYLTVDKQFDIDVYHCETFNTGTSPFFTAFEECQRTNEQRTYSHKILSHHIRWDNMSTGRCQGAIKDCVQPNFNFPHAMIHFLENIDNRSHEITPEHRKIAEFYKQRSIRYRLKSNTI